MELSSTCRSFLCSTCGVCASHIEHISTKRPASVGRFCSTCRSNVEQMSGNCRANVEHFFGRHPKQLCRAHVEELSGILLLRVVPSKL